LPQSRKASVYGLREGVVILPSRCFCELNSRPPARASVPGRQAALATRSGVLNRCPVLRWSHRRLRRKDWPPDRFHDDVTGRSSTPADEHPLQHVGEFRMRLGAQQCGRLATGFAIRGAGCVVTHGGPRP